MTEPPGSLPTLQTWEGTDTGSPNSNGSPTGGRTLGLTRSSTGFFPIKWATPLSAGRRKTCSSFPLQVDVTPAEASQLADPHSSLRQDSDHMRQPSQRRRGLAVADHGGHFGRRVAVRVGPLRLAHGVEVTSRAGKPLSSNTRESRRPAGRPATSWRWLHTKWFGPLRRETPHAAAVGCNSGSTRLLHLADRLCRVIGCVC